MENLPAGTIDFLKEFNVQNYQDFIFNYPGPDPELIKSVISKIAVVRKNEPVSEPVYMEPSQIKTYIDKHREPFPMTAEDKKQFKAWRKESQQTELETFKGSYVEGLLPTTTILQHELNRIIGWYIQGSAEINYEFYGAFHGKPPRDLKAMAELLGMIDHIQKVKRQALPADKKVTLKSNNKKQQTKRAKISDRQTAAVNLCKGERVTVDNHGRSVYNKYTQLANKTRPKVMATLPGNDIKSLLKLFESIIQYLENDPPATEKANHYIMILSPK